MKAAAHQKGPPELHTPGRINYTARQVANALTEAFTFYGLPVGYVSIKAGYLYEVLKNRPVIDVLKDKRIRLKHPWAFTLLALLDRQNMSLDYVPRTDTFVVAQRMPEAATTEDPPMIMATIELTGDEVKVMIDKIDQRKWERGEYDDHAE